MNHNLEIQKILLSIEKTENIEDKIKLLKQAISVADRNNDLEWGYDLRMDLIYQEKRTSHCVDSFQAFTWILDAVDANPELFDINDILLEYKCMIMAAYRNANLSAEQIQHIGNDFKTRMQTNGHGLYTYHGIMFQENMWIGKLEEARKFQQLRDSEQPDSVIAFCLACRINTNAEIELLSGHTDKAIMIADDLFSGRDTCKYEPFNTYSLFAYHLTRKNDPRGEDYYQKALEELQKMDSESYMLINISYLIFCASVFDKETAWNLFQKYSEWSIDADDYYCFYFATNLLSLLKKEKNRTLNLNSSLPYYFRTKADDLALRFDMRNGNTFFADTLKTIDGF